MIKKKICVKNCSMRRLSLIFQEILKFAFLFLLFFIWLRFLIRKNFVLVIVLSALLSVAIYLLFFFLRRRKKAKVGLKLKEKEDAENMFLSLACEENYMDFFEKLSLTKHKNVEKHKKYLTITHPEHVKTVLWADFSFDGLTSNKLLEIYKQVKKEKATKIVILCKEVSDKKVFTLLGSFKEKIEIFDQYQTYEKLYKYYNVFPEISKKYPSEKKLVLKDFFAYSFNKKRTKGYLFSALVLILSSLFLRTTIYYCIVASILVVFAIISQFNPRFNRKDNPEIL